jgi:hypothetical protein
MAIEYKKIEINLDQNPKKCSSCQGIILPGQPFYRSTNKIPIMPQMDGISFDMCEDCYNKGN